SGLAGATFGSAFTFFTAALGSAFLVGSAFFGVVSLAGALAAGFFSALAGTTFFADFFFSAMIDGVGKRELEGEYFSSFRNGRGRVARVSAGCKLKFQEKRCLVPLVFTCWPFPGTDGQRA